VSGDLVAELRAHGARDAARALVPAPPTLPPTRTREQVRAELGVPQGAALLLTVARLAPQKGLDVLAEAVRALGEAGKHVVAAVAGDGPLEPAVRGGPLRLLGVRRDVADLLGAADVVVVPSRWEGQPLVVQEALRAGAAIVATDAGGTREVTGEAARLVPPGDPAALAAAIEALLDDPAALAALREASTERAGTLPTAADALAQVTALYTRLLAARREPVGGAGRSG
jgi:glycosyltransferase involved in cell wall biosynthesis